MVCDVSKTILSFDHEHLIGIGWKSVATTDCQATTARNNFVYSQFNPASIGGCHRIRRLFFQQDCASRQANDFYAMRVSMAQHNVHPKLIHVWFAG